MPTLVVVGADDRLTPPAMAKSIADAIPGARLVGHPGGGAPEQHRAAGVFNEIVLDFLASASNAASP